MPFFIYVYKYLHRNHTFLRDKSSATMVLRVLVKSKRIVQSFYIVMFYLTSLAENGRRGLYFGI
jgi:hypothetical protein